MSEETKKLIGMLLGGVAAAICLVILYFLYTWMMGAFEVSRARVRVPVFLFFLPLVGMYYGWEFGSIIVDDLHALWKESTIFRAVVIVPTTYVTLVLVVIILFEPRPFTDGLSRMSNDDVSLLGKIIIFPFAFLAAIYWAFRIIRGRK